MNDDGNYDELDELDDEDNLGASPTAMTQVDTPVLDVTFRLLRKSHHLEKKKNPESCCQKSKEGIF